MRKHSHYTNYQQSALRFSVGDVVRPSVNGISDNAIYGEVVAVFPAIGMVDVQYTEGVKRHPVEDVIHTNERRLGLDDTPAGGQGVSLPNSLSVRKVASRYLRMLAEK